MTLDTYPLTPRTPFELRWFSPFVDWAIKSIHRRSQSLGVPFPEYTVWLSLQSSSKSTTADPDQGPLSPPPAAHVNCIQSVVAETGWLTWTDYLYLFRAQQIGSVGGWLCLYEWSRNTEALNRQMLFLEDILEQPEIKPFEQVLRKTIERGLLEMELRKTFPEQVKSRYREFYASGRSLNFGAGDLEDDIGISSVG